MVKNQRCILALVFCTVCGTASAENLNLKPGLWEQTFALETKGGPPISGAQKAEMDRAMANMPPDVRAKMEVAMKNAQSSMAKPTVKKRCIAKEDLGKALDFEGGKGDGVCTRTIVKSTASVQEIRLDCTKDTQKSTGTVKITASNPETYSGTLEGTVSDSGGATVMKAKMSGRWLGADCANVKPSTRK